MVAADEDSSSGSAAVYDCAGAVDGTDRVSLAVSTCGSQECVSGKVESAGEESCVGADAGGMADSVSAEGGSEVSEDSGASAGASG